MNDVNERLCDCLDDAICEVVNDVNDVIDVTSLVDAQRQTRLTAMDAAALLKGFALPASTQLH